MTTFDVLNRYGTAALARFVGALVLFLALHLIRIPLVLIVRVLEISMRRIDGYATRQASPSRGPTRPVNHWFPRSNPSEQEEYTDAYAA
jgi:hypothetical protein